MSLFQKKPCELAREVAQIQDQQMAMQALRYHGFSSWLFGATQEEQEQATSEELQQAINNFLAGRPTVWPKPCGND